MGSQHSRQQPKSGNSRLNGHGSYDTNSEIQFTSKQLPAGGQERARSKEAAVSRWRIPKNRKRRRIEDEDELAEPAHYTKTPMPTSIVTWQVDMLAEMAKHNPDFIHDLLNTADVESTKQRDKINTLESAIIHEREKHEEKEQLHNEKYKSLEERFAKLRIQAASALRGESEDTDIAKVSDETIVREWSELSYNIKNFVSDQFTEKPQDETGILQKIMNWPYAWPMIPIDEISGLRKSILRRGLWFMIHHHIFSKYGKNWCGNISQALAHHIAKQGNKLSQ